MHRFGWRGLLSWWDASVCRFLCWVFDLCFIQECNYMSVSVMVVEKWYMQPFKLLNWNPLVFHLELRVFTGPFQTVHPHWHRRIEDVLLQIWRAIRILVEAVIAGCIQPYLHDNTKNPPQWHLHGTENTTRGCNSCKSYLQLLRELHDIMFIYVPFTSHLYTLQIDRNFSSVHPAKEPSASMFINQGKMRATTWCHLFTSWRSVHLCGMARRLKWSLPMRLLGLVEIRLRW